MFSIGKNCHNMIGCPNLLLCLKACNRRVAVLFNDKYNLFVNFQWLQQSNNLQKLFSSFVFAAEGVEDSLAPAA